jgi:predicted acetyltransferase
VNSSHTIKLVWPSEHYLPGCIAALQRGWSPDSLRGADATRDELSMISEAPARYLEGLIDREAKGPSVVLPDGSTVSRLPSFRRWLWDGEFCGFISLQWQPGTPKLPAHCLGHISYAVVPWKRGKGYATQALRQFLPEAKAEGLPYVELTTDTANVASRRVIEANGGVFIEEFTKPAQFGGRKSFRFRIPLH